VAGEEVIIVGNIRSNMNIYEIVNLWYETQHGHYLKCRKAQIKFSEEMHKLHEAMNQQQTHGDEPI
tara:strand:- start:2641 stop:2838 length:198 start_codon:yes stop_codon:yes gene_type:complete